MKLKLPPTLALPAPEDVPKGYDLLALDAARAAARIEPGYVLSVPREPRPFTFGDPVARAITRALPPPGIRALPRRRGRRAGRRGNL